MSSTDFYSYFLAKTCNFDLKKKITINGEASRRLSEKFVDEEVVYNGSESHWNSKSWIFLGGEKTSLQLIKDLWNKTMNGRWVWFCEMLLGFQRFHPMETVCFGQPFVFCSGTGQSFCFHQGYDLRFAYCAHSYVHFWSICHLLTIFSLVRREN